MASEKLLNGVAFNIMDHAMSGLSYIHPHVCQAARQVGLNEVVLELMEKSPCPKGIQHEPLKRAAEALHLKFLAILAHAGFEQDAIASQKLIFDCSKGAEYDYNCPVVSELKSRTGKIFRHQRA